MRREKKKTPDNNKRIMVRTTHLMVVPLTFLFAGSGNVQSTLELGFLSYNTL